MYNLHTTFSVAIITSFLIIGSIDGISTTIPNESSLIARGAGGGREGGASVSRRSRRMEAHPMARNNALQRTPAMSRANLNRYDAGVNGAAAGYAAGSASSAGSVYPATTYYYGYPNGSTTAP